MLRRLSSVELRVSQEETPSGRGSFVFLSVTRSSTFALVTTMMCAYAWLISIGVGSSCLTASLIEYTQSSLLSLERDHLVFQHTLEDFKRDTMLAKKDLDVAKMTCLEASAYEEMFCAQDAAASLTLAAEESL